MIGGKGGWFKESTRHSLAARGIPTAYYSRKGPGMLALGRSYFAVRDFNRLSDAEKNAMMDEFDQRFKGRSGDIDYESLWEEAGYNIDPDEIQELKQKRRDEDVKQELRMAKGQDRVLRRVRKNVAFLPGDEGLSPNMLQEWKDANADVKKFRELAKQMQDAKATVPMENRKELEELRAQASKDMQLAKERASILGAQLRYAEEEGLLDAGQRTELLRMGRRRLQEKLDREALERAGAKQRDMRQKIAEETAGEFIELEDLPKVMATGGAQPPVMREGRVKWQQEAIARERRKLGFREERPVEELVLPKPGLGKITPAAEVKKSTWATEPARATGGLTAFMSDLGVNKVVEKNPERVVLEVVDIPKKGGAK